MKKLFVAIFVLLLIFGCIDLGGKQLEQPAQNNTTVIIKVEPQKNVTVVINRTEEEEKPQEWQGLTYRSNPDAMLGIYFIDACDYESGKHAAAILVKKEDFDMLIDGGGESSGVRVVEFLKSRGVDDIEVLVSSAEDEGRYKGLQKIAEEFNIEEFWWANQATTEDYRNMVNMLKGKAKKTVVVSAGYARELNGIEIDVLNPTKTGGDIYNDAIVLLLTDREQKALLLSNIKAGAQGYILNNYKKKINKPVFMEAPYYGLGAGTAAIGIFLQDVKPKSVIINGCAEGTVQTREPFMRLLKQYNIDYWETYTKGNIRATISTMKITTEINGVPYETNTTTTSISTMLK